MLIPLGTLASAFKANITAVESTLWSGGSTSGPGANVIKYTSETLVAGATYAVTVGAANSNSSAFSRTATVSSSSAANNVNGTTTTYATTGNTSVIYYNFTPDGRYYYRGDAYAYGGKPGAAGNGGNGATYPYSYSWSGGNGGSPYASVTSIGLAGFPATGVGVGGAGTGTPSVPIYDSYGGYIAFYAYGGGGSASPTGANTGNGTGSGVSAGSGGMTLKYPDTQPVLVSTTGTVTYLQSGGFHNYFWKSTGSFTV